MTDETPDDVIAQEDEASRIEAERAGDHAAADEHAGHDHGDHEGHDHSDHEGHDHGDHDDHGGGHHAPDPNEGVLVGEPPTPAWVGASVVIALVTLVACVILGVALQDQVPDKIAPVEDVAPATAEH